MSPQDNKDASSDPGGNRECGYPECEFVGVKTKNFAQGLAEKLRNPGRDLLSEDKNSYTIALCGAWGSGKTHFLRSVRQCLDESCSDCCVMDFDPWAFGGTGQLAKQFFTQLSECIDSLGSSGDPDGNSNQTGNLLTPETKRKIVNALGGMGGMLSVSGPLLSALGVSAGIHLVESVGAMVKEGAAGVSAGIGDQDKKKDDGADGSRALSVPSLCRLKADVDKCIKDIGDMRIVVIVDNIDRLSSEDIATLFQLISTLGDFPKVSYLLSFDYDLVVRSLSSVQTGEAAFLNDGEPAQSLWGERYLEKVLSWRLELPPLDLSSLISSLVEGAGETCDQILFSGLGDDALTSAALSAALETPRTALRVFDGWQKRRDFSLDGFSPEENATHQILKFAMFSISQSHYRALMKELALPGGGKAGIIVQDRRGKGLEENRDLSILTDNKINDVDGEEGLPMKWEERRKDAFAWYEGLFNVPKGGFLFDVKLDGRKGSLGVVVERLREGLDSPDDALALRFWILLYLLMNTRSEPRGGNAVDQSPAESGADGWSLPGGDAKEMIDEMLLTFRR